MKNKLFACLLCLAVLFSHGFAAFAVSADETYTVAQIQNICDGIVVYKENQSGARNVQELIDGYLTDNAGIYSEFYVMALSQSGSYRWDRYESALLRYLNSYEIPSAASREKYALALCAASSDDRYIYEAADEAIGGLGIMSLVFGLHLLNNGYPSARYSIDGLIDEILNCRKSDGGWAVTGSWGDVDVTAMTIQALAPYYGSRSDVSAAVDRALGMLSDRQLDSGGYRTMGAENSESAAQVVIALSALGIDAQYDERFIKNGNSVMSAFLRYRCSDGSFAHTTASDETATVEALCALTAYCRMCRGQSQLYLFDRTGTTQPARQNEPGKSSGGGSNRTSGGASNQNPGTGNHTDNDDRGQTGAVDTDNGSRGSSSGTSSASGSGQNTRATDAAGKPVAESTAAGTETVEQTKPTYGGFQPAATADQRIATSDQGGTGGGYKLYAILGVVGVAGGACAVLFLLKKRNKKHYIAVGILAAAGVIFILLTDFKSPDAYRQAAPTDGEISVTLSIRCDTITDREKVNKYIPDDGIILDEEVITVSEGSTVYDALLAVVKEHGIPMDNRGAPGAAYIAGLNYLYEFDYGELSGWMYRVNGVFADVGCQSCYVSDGDVIEWLYTTDIGKDLE